MAAYNEADLIGSTAVAAALVPGVVGVIVADDGSRDDTAKVAMQSGALVVNTGSNKGKGAAMELAASTLERMQPFGAIDGVLLLDADLGESAAAAADLLVPLTKGSADMVVGILPSPPGKAGFGMVRGLAREGIAVFGDGFEAQAPISGQRALTLECLRSVRPFASGYAMEVAMTIAALKQKMRVVEVPVAMTHRATGRDLKGFIHRGKQYFEINRLLNSYFKQK